MTQQSGEEPKKLITHQNLSRNRFVMLALQLSRKFLTKSK
uniref:Uncharacterized protein n=1 Tax=Vibrio tasmaniensis TaxID=212663 RepID=A0A0H3ZU57_9VIBR|nr:hypothetical protein [Vibrio tasmaniensis]